jgi:hypothetical protein
MDDLELYIYIALGVIYFLSRAFRKKKPVAPPRNQRNAEPDYGNNRAPQKEKQVTFEDLLREFTGQKKEPVYDYEEEEGEADVSSYEEESYYSEEELREKEYADREEVEYKSYDEVYNVNKDFKTLDEQVDIELNKKKRFEEYKIEEQVNVHTAKRFRELLQNKDSIKDAIILKEILDRKYF